MVNITDRSLHRLLGELSTDVKHILAALDRNQAELSRVRSELSSDLTKMDNRVSALEKNQNKLLGVALLIPLILSVVVRFI